MHATRSLSSCSLALLATLGFVACEPTTITPDLDGGAELDAGADAGSTEEALCQENLPVGPPCCGVDGNRVMSAECGADGWTCDEGALCECGGEPASFICSDACGSDAFVDPECVDGAWSCGELVRSDTCASDTCWALPGDCCVNPSCVDGEWQCESLSC